MVVEAVPNGDDRSHYQRDRDIILYTSAFKRLSGITQVTSSYTGHVFHNRLTHSLQVAQVGRSLAQKLLFREKTRHLANQVQLIPEAVEAGCLAHDLGHPPFGHVAEEVLNELVGEDAEGFEGNAQSLRILTELAFRASKFPGLNLTRATLRAVLKYPWTFERRPMTAEGKKSKKWGAYASGLPALEFAMGATDGAPVEKSLGAKLMDWADDLTYAIHDAEDFYRAGIIPLHQLASPGSGSSADKERLRFLSYVNERKKTIPELKDVSAEELDKTLGDILLFRFTIDAPYEGTRDHRARLRMFTSGMVGRYINALELLEKDAQVKVRIDPHYEKEIALLKQLTWCYVIEAPALAMQQYAQKNVIRFLFRVFLEESRKRPCRLLSLHYQERLKEISADEPMRTSGLKRMVADLLAGMTELQAMTVYQRLNGMTSTPGLEQILI